jgi:Ca-activated chloride channel homolog
VKPLNISIRSDRNLVERDQESVRHVVAEVSAPAPENSIESKSVNLGLVIDASASMSGPRIESAKWAAIRIVETMSENDILTVVSFSSDVQVHVDRVSVTSSNRKQAIAQIEALGPRSNTNLSSGWLKAVELVAEAGSTASSPDNSRVVVISDGYANAGVVDPKVLTEHARELLNRGVSTSTIGIGADYWPEQLEAIADGGGGLLHHASRDQELAELVLAELETTRHLVATNITLKIRVPSGARAECLNDLPVSNATGSYEYEYVLGSLVGGADRDAVIRIHLPRIAASGRQEIEASVIWTDVLDGVISESESVITVFDVADTPGMRYLPIDRDVCERVATVWLARTVRSAISLARRGEYPAANSLLTKLRPEFASYVSLLENGADLMKEYDTAVANVTRDLNPMTSSETSALYYRKHRSVIDMRNRKYEMAFSKVVEDVNVDAIPDEKPAPRRRRRFIGIGRK